MKHIALMMALVVCASVVGYAAFVKARPGLRYVSPASAVPLAKDQSRIAPEGCISGEFGFICRGE